MAPSPKSESVIAVKSPSVTPATSGMIALRPCEIDWLITKSIVGPGTTRTIVAARTNATQISKFTTSSVLYAILFYKF
jgi:hypothetical protein